MTRFSRPSRALIVAAATAILPAGSLLSGCGGGSGDGGVLTLVRNPFTGNYSGTYTLANGETTSFTGVVGSDGRLTISANSPSLGRFTLTGEVHHSDGRYSASGHGTVNGQNVTINAAGQIQHQNGLLRLNGTLTLSNNNNGTIQGNIVQATPTTGPTANPTTGATARPTTVPTGSATPTPTQPAGNIAGVYSGIVTISSTPPGTGTINLTISSTGRVTGTIAAPGLGNVSISGQVTGVQLQASGSFSGGTVNLQGAIADVPGAAPTTTGSIFTSNGLRGVFSASRQS